MRIKVCGMTNAEQVLQLDEMGVEFAGFIFYPKSPRYVYRSMPKSEIKKIKGRNINKVGVFVNATVDEVLEAVDDCGSISFSCTAMKRQVLRKNCQLCNGCKSIPPSRR
jgi:phosphoribosylanthranilate isomerase